MRHPILATLALLVAWPLAASSMAQAQEVGSVRHIPTAEGEPGQSLEIVATVSRGWESNLELRFRPPGSVSWKAVTFARRDSTTYVATIPADAVTPPGLEYFITTTGDAPQTRFASSEMPHRVNVFRSPKEVRRRKHLKRHDNRRAFVRVAGEIINYGSRDIGTAVIPDQYNRFDGEVGYRMLNFPLKTLSFGYTYLVGETPGQRSADGQCTGTTGSGIACSFDAGFRTSGWFQLRFLITDGIELDGRGIVMATPGGFNMGVRGELRIGDANGTHLGLGTEILPDVGTSGHVRLGWGTVPGFPMATTVEVTNFPAPHRDAAVRLIYDVSRPFANGFRIGGRFGYQARDQQVGGVSVGLHASLEF